MQIDDLQIVSSANTDKLRETRVTLRSGERTLIVGAPRHGENAAVSCAGRFMALGQRAHHAPEG